MAIVTDTNILSSLAAAEALAELPKLFQGETFYLPPAVEQELRPGLVYGKKHIERVFQAVQTNSFQVLELTEMERVWVATLPATLHAGEREGIILCQVRQYLFLSNDRRAIRYCQANGIQAISLEILLRLLWTRQIISASQVRGLIELMAKVENLTLSERQLMIIFAPRSS